MNTTQTIKEVVSQALRAQRIGNSLARQGIELDTRNGYHVRGNTRPVRAVLKAAGFRWFYYSLVWSRTDRAVYRDVSPAELGASMLRELAR